MATLMNLGKKVMQVEMNGKKLLVKAGEVVKLPNPVCLKASFDDFGIK